MQRLVPHALPCRLTQCLVSNAPPAVAPTQHANKYLPQPRPFQICHCCTTKVFYLAAAGVCIVAVHTPPKVHRPAIPYTKTTRQTAHLAVVDVHDVALHAMSCVPANMASHQHRLRCCVNAEKRRQDDDRRHIQVVRDARGAAGVADANAVVAAAAAAATAAAVGDAAAAAAVAATAATADASGASATASEEL
eukprot:365304-Chlamydomonas_euryale.AAC.10